MLKVIHVVVNSDAIYKDLTNALQAERASKRLWELAIFDSRILVRERIWNLHAFQILVGENGEVDVKDKLCSSSPDVLGCPEKFLVIVSDLRETGALVTVSPSLLWKGYLLLGEVDKQETDKKEKESALSEMLEISFGSYIKVTLPIFLAKCTTLFTATTQPIFTPPRSGLVSVTGGGGIEKEKKAKSRLEDCYLMSIEGPALSGKSTLLQWLQTYACARPWWSTVGFVDVDLYLVPKLVEWERGRKQAGELLHLIGEVNAQVNEHIQRCSARIVVLVGHLQHTTALQNGELAQLSLQLLKQVKARFAVLESSEKIVERCWNRDVLPIILHEQDKILSGERRINFDATVIRKDAELCYKVLKGDGCKVLPQLTLLTEICAKIDSLCLPAITPKPVPRFYYMICFGTPHAHKGCLPRAPFFVNQQSAAAVSSKGTGGVGSGPRGRDGESGAMIDFEWSQETRTLRVNGYGYSPLHYTNADFTEYVAEDLLGRILQNVAARGGVDAKDVKIEIDRSQPLWFQRFLTLHNEQSKAPSPLTSQPPPGPVSTPPKGRHRHRGRRTWQKS